MEPGIVPLSCILLGSSTSSSAGVIERLFEHFPDPWDGVDFVFRLAAGFPSEQVVSGKVQ